MKITLIIENHGVAGLPNVVKFSAPDLLVAVQSDGGALLACPAPNKTAEALSTWLDWKLKSAPVKLNLMLSEAFIVPTSSKMIPLADSCQESEGQ